MDGFEGGGDGDDVVLHDARPVLDVADFLQTAVELLAERHPLLCLLAEARCLRLELSRLVVEKLLVHVDLSHTCRHTHTQKEGEQENT